MIITSEEYKELGFTSDDPEELDSCLKRAEYVILALTEGQCTTALAAGGEAAAMVKRAAAFQTYLMLQNGRMEQASESTERVSIGDFSYSSGVSCSADSSLQDGGSDISLQTIRLLRAAGCMYGGRCTAE